jgi:hypothetical protein
MAGAGRIERKQRAALPPAERRCTICKDKESWKEDVCYRCSQFKRLGVPVVVKEEESGVDA